MVFRELGTAIVVMPSIDTINTFQFGFVAQFLCQFLSDTVDAANRGNDPNLISYAHISIFTFIALEGAVFFLDGQFFTNRIVRIFEGAGKIGLQVVLIHPVACFQVLQGMTDGIAVFDDVLTLFDILDEYFVTCRSVLI